MNATADKRDLGEFNEEGIRKRAGGEMVEDLALTWKRLKQWIHLIYRYCRILREHNNNDSIEKEYIFWPYRTLYLNARPMLTAPFFPDDLLIIPACSIQRDLRKQYPTDNL